MGRYGDPVGGDIHCDYCGYNHEPPHCPSPWGYMPSPETVAATDKANRLREAKRKAKELLADVPGVLGFGLGDGVVHVYLERKDVEEQLLPLIGDLPIKFIVTGVIRAF